MCIQHNTIKNKNLHGNNNKLDKIKLHLTQRFCVLVIDNMLCI